MELLPGILILLGLVIFMVGYYYIAKSNGQSECNKDKKEIESSQSANYIGGIVGVVIAIILVIVGFILNSQTAKAAIIKTLSSSPVSQPSPLVSRPLPRPSPLASRPSPLAPPTLPPALPPRVPPTLPPRVPPTLPPRVPTLEPTFTPPPAYRENI